MVHTFRSETIRKYLKKKLLLTNSNEFAKKMAYSNTKLCIKHLEITLSDPLFCFHSKDKLDFDPEVYLKLLLKADRNVLKDQAYNIMPL